MSAVTVLPTSTDTFGVWLKLPNHEDNVHVCADVHGIVIGRDKNSFAPFSDGALIFNPNGQASFQYADANKQAQEVKLSEEVVFAEISHLLTRLHAAAVDEARRLLDAETVTPLDPTP
jgi:hypothetical protein